MHEPRPLAGLRIVLLALFLGFGALGTPWPWAALWVVVPVVVAASILLAWRFGRAALVLPALLVLAAVGTMFAGWSPWLVAWPALASVVGVWMGIREEGGGPTLGERAWMLAPLLLLAAALPLTPGFPAAVTRLDGQMRMEQDKLLASVKPGEMPASIRSMMDESARLPVEQRQRRLLLVVPNVMFLGVVMLVVSGRALAARIAAMLGWPTLSRAPLASWRLPDAALVPLVAGIALVAFADRAWHPSALTLLVHVVLGYSVQGVAVVESTLLARGLSPAFVALTMLFVIAVSLFWVLPVVAVVGLSDVWLDYRRLEPSRGEA